MSRTRLDPTVRKDQIITAAIELARRDGYENVRREGVAAQAGIAPGLVSKYWGTMPQLRRAIMRHAIEIEDLIVIAQGIARGDPCARKAPQKLKDRALAQLASA